MDILVSGDSPTSNGIFIKNADNNVFLNVLVNTPAGGTGGCPIKFEQMPSRLGFPSQNAFYMVHPSDRDFTAALCGTVGTGGAFFWPWPGNDPGPVTLPNIYSLDFQGNFTRNLNIDGSEDAIQLSVKGHSTQTNELFLVEKDDGTDLLSVKEGVITALQDIFIDGQDNEVQLRIQGDSAQSVSIVVIEEDGGADRFLVGTDSAQFLSNLSVSGQANEIQLKVTGSLSQVADLAVFEQNDGTDVARVTSSGKVWMKETLDFAGIAKTNLPTSGNNIGYCLDCQADATCTGGGTGAWFRCVTASCECSW